MKMSRLFKNGLITGIVLGVTVSGLIFGGSSMLKGREILELQATKQSLEIEQDLLLKELNAYKSLEEGTENVDMVMLDWIQIANVTDDGIYLDIGGDIIKIDYKRAELMDISW